MLVVGYQIFVTPILFVDSCGPTCSRICTASSRWALKASFDSKNGSVQGVRRARWLCRILLGSRSLDGQVFALACSTSASHEHALLRDALFPGSAVGEDCDESNM